MLISYFMYVQPRQNSSQVVTMKLLDSDLEVIKSTLIEINKHFE